jgi:hypothetical protein
MTFSVLLQGGVCVFALLAAILWFISAGVKIPHIARAAEWGEEGVDAFPNALKKQARWSALGAGAAATAALLQFLALAPDFWRVLGRLSEIT